MPLDATARARYLQLLLSNRDLRSNKTATGEEGRAVPEDSAQINAQWVFFAATGDNVEDGNKAAKGSDPMLAAELRLMKQAHLLNQHIYTPPPPPPPRKPSTPTSLSGNNQKN